MKHRRWIALILLLPLAAVASPPPATPSFGDSSGGGVPPIPQSDPRAKGTHGRYTLQLTPMGQFGQLSIVDGLGGPSVQHVTVKRVAPHSRSTLWANKTASSEKDATLLVSSLGARLLVIRWDRSLVSPLVAVDCECAAKELADGTWHIYLDYSFADQTSRRRFAGSFLDEKSCEKYYPKAFPQCDQNVEKEADFKRVKDALKKASPAPSYGQVSFCRGTLEGRNGYTEAASLRLVENEADATEARAVWVGKAFPALTCPRGSLDQWTLYCHDRDEPRPVGFHIKMSLSRDKQGNPIANLSEYRDLVGRYLTGSLRCTTKEAVTELDFKMKAFQRSGFFRQVPEWMPPSPAQLTLSYFRRGDRRNQIRHLVYTDGSAQIETAGAVTQLRFPNGARFPLPITNTIRGVHLDLPWGQRVGIDKLSAVFQQENGLKVRYYDDAKGAWLLRDLP